MKKHITNAENVLEILKEMPLIAYGDSNAGLSEIYRYAHETKYTEFMLTMMCFQYGFALGKHAERARKK